MANHFRINKFRFISLVIVVGYFFISDFGLVLDVINKNANSMKLLDHFLLKTGQTQDITSTINTVITDECQRYWMLGLLAHENGDSHERNVNWQKNLACSDFYLGGIYRLATEDRSLAEYAVMKRPDNEISWLWLAHVMRADPASVIPLYQEAIKIQPYNGLTWYRIGEAYESTGDLTSALEAFIISCEYLNRGSNCFVRAGQIMEKIGDIPAAIDFYRRSIFEDAHNRADYLESQQDE